MGKFRKWLEAHGNAAQFAKKAGVHRSAVNGWIRGTSTPAPRLAIRLVRWGRGAFDHNDIVRDTFNRSRRDEAFRAYRKRRSKKVDPELVPALKKSVTQSRKKSAS